MSLSRTNCLFMLVSYFTHFHSHHPSIPFIHLFYQTIPPPILWPHIRLTSVVSNINFRARGYLDTWWRRPNVNLWFVYLALPLHLSDWIVKGKYVIRPDQPSSILDFTILSTSTKSFGQFAVIEPRHSTPSCITWSEQVNARKFASQLRWTRRSHIGEEEKNLILLCFCPCIKWLLRRDTPLGRARHCFFPPHLDCTLQCNSHSNSFRLYWHWLRLL